MTLDIFKREKKRNMKNQRGRSCFCFSISSQKLSTCGLYRLGFWKPFSWNFEGMKGMLLLLHRIDSEVKSLSRVRLFAIPWTVAYWAPPSMEFSRQEYWSGVPFHFR